jgi:D-proline reductase (dithiol) PrdB
MADIARPTPTSETNMVRLADLDEDDREHLLAKPCPAFSSAPFVSGPPLSARRLAIVTTAGLVRRGDAPFALQSGDYRPIPGETDGSDLVMSHSSVNFDRTGFQHDVNVVFPIDRARELVAEGTLGSLASVHYSFMGASLDAEGYEPGARELAGLLHRDGVNAVVLSPV